jgi:hypothetical protein
MKACHTISCWLRGSRPLTPATLSPRWAAGRRQADASRCTAASWRLCQGVARCRPHAGEPFRNSTLGCCRRSRHSAEPLCLLARQSGTGPLLDEDGHITSSLGENGRMRDHHEFAEVFALLDAPPHRHATEPLDSRGQRRCLVVGEKFDPARVPQCRPASFRRTQRRLLSTLADHLGMDDLRSDESTSQAL